MLKKFIDFSLQIFLLIFDHNYRINFLLVINFLWIFLIKILYKIKKSFKNNLRKNVWNKTKKFKGNALICSSNETIS